MAKIDVSKIEGFDAMTDAEKIAALTGYEFEEKHADSSEVTKLKNALNKANGEAAEYKRQIREKQSEQERLAAEQEEENKKVREERDALLKEKTVLEYTAKYLAMGYDNDLAADTAKALSDGDMQKVFANQETFQKKYKQSIENGELQKQQKLTGGKPAGKDDVDVDKMKAAFAEACGVTL